MRLEFPQKLKRLQTHFHVTVKKYFTLIFTKTSFTALYEFKNF